MTTDNIISFKLRKCLMACMELAQQEGLDMVSSAMQDVMDNLDSPMQLAIIGKISSSKSTLVNAILGKDDVVEMGQMETTYNVSWLKYGSSDADIKVVFKDGCSEMVKREQWKKWSSGKAESKLRDTVKYIEVSYDHEILRHVNIIDTPGLDSTLGVDSRNTIEFLKDVRPDAILMVFTKALAESTVTLVKEFQGDQNDGMRLSPLNAMGVLSKIDLLWSQNNTRFPIEIAQLDIIENNIYHLFPEIRETLYGIKPVCAMLGLASNTIKQRDMDLIISLSQTNPDILREMFHSVNDFMDDYFKTSISVSERSYLQKKFGLYGIYELLSFVKQGHYDLPSVAEYLQRISGFNKFCSCLYSHFGQRSYLIKTQSIQQIIAQACDKQREKTKENNKGRKAIDKIQEEILATLIGVFEYKQLDFLSKIYEGNMNITDKSAIEEYKRVCGEYGDSVISRLNMSRNDPITKMGEEASKRAQTANRKATMNQMHAPHDAELYRMLSLSYANLSQRITEMQQKREEAEKVICITNDFFYGE